MLRPCSVDGHVDGMLTLTTVGPGSSIVDLLLRKFVVFLQTTKNLPMNKSMEVNFSWVIKYHLVESVTKNITTEKKKHFRNHKKIAVKLVTP